ncbi:MAG: transposase [Ktedonobacterales bacterium]|nr:transposase [Ktedonobacterales bacterium]
MTLSMCRKGNCWDNALMDSVWGTLKMECADHHVFATYQEARTILFAYLEVFDHRQRLHSALGCQSPAHSEQTAISSDSSPTPSNWGKVNMLGLAHGMTRPAVH